LLVADANQKPAGRQTKDVCDAATANTDQPFLENNRRPTNRRKRASNPRTEIRALYSCCKTGFGGESSAAVGGSLRL